MVMLVGTLPTVSPQKTILSNSLVDDNEAHNLSGRLEGGWRLEVGGWGWGQELQTGNEMNGQKPAMRNTVYRRVSFFLLRSTSQRSFQVDLFKRIYH